MKQQTLIILLVVTTFILIAVLVLDDQSLSDDNRQDPDVTEGLVDSNEVSTTTVDEVGSTSNPSVIDPGTAKEPSVTPTVPVSEKPMPTAVRPATPTVSSIVLLDTESDTMVTIATARLTRPGFIAIYRTNSNERTELIGHSSFLLPGTYTNLLIQVDSPVARKQVVTAVIHEDDGDGEFEFPVSDSYFRNGSSLVYDEDVVDVPIVEEFGLINGTVEAHLEDARRAMLGS